MKTYLLMKQPVESTYMIRIQSTGKSTQEVANTILDAGGDAMAGLKAIGVSDSEIGGVLNNAKGSVTDTGKKILKKLGI